MISESAPQSVDKSTKDILLETGLELFAHAPYEGVSVQDIVNRVHVTKPTLYHHFGSKLGFYKAVFDQYLTPFFDIIVEKSIYKNDLINNLNEIAKCTMDYMMSNPDLFWMIEHALCISSGAEHYSFVSERLEKISEAVRFMFKQAVAQHGNLRGKESLMMWMFLAAVRTAVDAVLRDYEPYTPDLPYKVVHQFMYGIFS